MVNFEKMPENCEITVTCASGVEKVLKSELIRLGYPDVPAINGGLTFNGNLEAVARCNLNLRTADRVYVKLAEFGVEDFDCLYESVKNVAFESYLPSDSKVIVDGKCVKSKLFAISACQSIIKKAIADKLCKKYKLNSLPENGAEYRIEFSIFKDVASIYLNTSGAGLHKRGYRDLVGIAPIKETLASALLLLSDFYWERPLSDPFCGSGTIAIEGAKIALNIAPGLLRDFAFNSWKNFDKSIFERAIEEAKDKEKLDRKINVTASDIDSKAIKLAIRHAERAGLSGKIDFSVKDVKNFTNSNKFGSIVTNPPYGERVYDRQEAEECYKSLGKAFNNLDRWSAFVITSDKNFERFFGKKADRERKLYNSNKECKFYYYYANKKEIKDDRR